jgi:hypothetical protein
LVCQIVAPLHEPVEAVVRRAFGRYGLPKAMRSDNGPPFAAAGPGGLTRLSLGWLKAGIALERIAPDKPQQNGRHERFHRTLKQETSRPPAANAREQQARFDAFCQDYNHLRPHEAIGQRPPASLWRPSPRRYPEKLAQPWYDAHHALRRVRASGEIKWGGAPSSSARPWPESPSASQRHAKAIGSFAMHRSISTSSTQEPIA